MIVVAAAATVTINQMYFWLARIYARQRVAALRANRRVLPVLDRIERHGTWLVFFSRFAYGFRIAIPAACGATGMSPLKFAIGDVVGSIVWSIAVGLAGFAIGSFSIASSTTFEGMSGGSRSRCFAGCSPRWRGTAVMCWRCER